MDGKATPCVLTGAGQKALPLTGNGKRGTMKGKATPCVLTGAG